MKTNREDTCKLFRCEKCSKEISEDEMSENLGFCDKCDAEGYWLDPVGGIHSADETDSAAMYE